MNPENFNKSMEIELNQSLLIKLIIFIPHLVSFCIVLWLLDIQLLIRILLLSLIVTSLFYYLRKYIFLTDKTVIRKIKYDSNQKWSIFLENNEQHEVELLPTSYISNWLIIFNFKQNKTIVRTAILTKDSTEKAYFRRLKILANTFNA